jgi:uncharacterized protein YprB with RNaseH-like and TPR domain
VSDLSRKLDRFSKHLVGEAAPQQKSSITKVYQPPERYERMAKHLGGQLIRTPTGAFCEVVRNYSLAYRHGNAAFDEFRALKRWPLSAYSADETPGDAPTSSMLFVDTETTGLGGTGAVAFLVGLGRVARNGFEVRQYVIPDYSDEAAMLETLDGSFTEDQIVVSYNGLAFDLPLLRDRMIVNRVSREIPVAYHIDLLHAVRRLFRRRLGDCSLTNIEREVFEFYRNDDIPGYLVPSVYFDWLSDESLTDMEGVLEHNRLDIVSLFFLGGLLASVFQSDGEALTEIDDIHSLARLYGRRRQFKRTAELFHRIDSDDNAPLSPDVLLYHAYNFKRHGDWDEAVRLWQQLDGQSGREEYWAHLELAKYFEHRRPDLQAALRHAEAAQEVSPYGESHQKRLRARLIRLRRKLNS